MYIKFKVENLTVRNTLIDLGLHGRIIIIKTYIKSVLVWSRAAQDMTGAFQRRNEPSGFINGREFLD
jgi:hypothetical protein